MKKIYFLAMIIFSMSCFAQVMQFNLNLKHQDRDYLRESSSRINAKLGHEFIFDREDLKAVLLASKMSEDEGKIFKMKGDLLKLKVKVYSKKGGDVALIDQLELISQVGKETVYSFEEKSEKLVEIKIKSSRL